MTTEAIHSKVAGVTAKNPDGSPRQAYIRVFCKPGMPATLIREPGNPHYKNAVGVWIKARALIFFTRSVQIGYLHPDLAEEIAPYMDGGGKVSCQIAEVTGGSRGKSSHEVNILVTRN